MKSLFHQIRFPLILFLCFSLAFPPELLAQAFNQTPDTRRQTIDFDGKRTRVTELDGTVINWQYDALNRLIAEDYNAPGDANDFEHTYVYDLVGNRLQKHVADGNDTVYSYDPNNDELLSEITDSNNITYGYDDSGSLAKESNDVTDLVTYTYNLKNRLASVTTGGTTVSYKYNPDGIRVKADDGTNVTEYLLDPFNHTGYAQVFKEKQGATETAYIIGLDVLAQATGTADPQYLLYDGHGSVRHLANSTGAITESYAYDGYGNALNFNPADAATELLYAGEIWDSHWGGPYLRNRYYDPSTGRLNRLDSDPGNLRDPQSLHKYLYAYCDPINLIDPSGEFSLSDVTSAISIGGKI